MDNPVHDVHDVPLGEDRKNSVRSTQPQALKQCQFHNYNKHPSNKRSQSLLLLKEKLGKATKGSLS